MDNIMAYIVRVLTEDCEIEQETTEPYPTEIEGWDAFHITGMYTFDTESEFLPGDPYWTIQLINTEDGRVIAETNSVLEAKRG